MDEINKDLLLVLDIEKWQALQDALAVVTGMAIITVDYKGVPVTKHSGCSEFCSQVRRVPLLNAQCQKCDSRGGLEATRLRKPYIYLCHAKILDAAVPIIVKGQYLGAIMIGQVILTDESDTRGLEILCEPNPELIRRELGGDAQLFDRLPQLSLGRVKTILDMLFHLCGYIAGSALDKMLAAELYMGMIGRSTRQGELSSYPLESLQGIRRALDSTIITSGIDHTSVEYPAVSSVLRPALEYISTHKGERCAMNDMAVLCHISPGYFSKLFLQEMGKTYTSYLLEVRIKWARELLISTDKAVGEIAQAIGFSDAGHFIKSFRRIEGVTPGEFREMQRL